MQTFHIKVARETESYRGIDVEAFVPVVGLKEYFAINALLLDFSFAEWN